MTKVYINGKFFDKSEAKVSVYDHGLLYGDGVFEGIRIYSGKIFRLQEHLDRLYDSARAIYLEIPVQPEQLAEDMHQAIRINNRTGEGYIRALVTRGAGSLGLDPRKTTNPQIIIIVDDISLYPREMYDSGLSIVSVGTIRNHPNALNPRVKSLNYLNSIIAKMEAIQAGCVEALMVNHRGEIAECTGDNIFVVKHGVLKTPPPDAGILEGITRGAIMELGRAAGIPVQEVTMTRHDVYTADECFLTGTAAEVIPVVKCDGHPIGNGKPGAMTALLRDRFQELVRR